VLVKVAGKDASGQFAMFHKSGVLEQYAPGIVHCYAVAILFYTALYSLHCCYSGSALRCEWDALFHNASTTGLQVGVLAGAGGAASGGAKKVSKSVAMLSKVLKKNSFGDMVPYGDPNWYQGYVLWTYWM
jgi:hypothetical protein